MVNRRKYVVGAVGVIALLLIVAGAVIKTTQASEVEQARRVLGAWSLDANSAAIGYFPALIVFNSDGAAIGSSKPIGTESPSYGSWISRNPSTIAMTMEALSSDTSRNYVGRLKFISTLQYSSLDDTWSGPYRLDIFDTNGNVLARDSGTFHLKRITVVTTLP